MKQFSLEEVLAYSPKANYSSEMTPVSSPFTPMANELRFGRPGISIRNKIDDPRFTPASPFTAKMNTLDMIEASPASRVLQKTFSRISEVQSKIFNTPNQEGNSSKLHRSGTFRIKKNLRMLRTMSPDPDSLTMNNTTGQNVQTPDALKKPNVNNTSDSHYVKQGTYIKLNPHFKKFNRTKSVIDRLDTEKVPFRKETFYYPERIKILEDAASMKTDQDDDFSLMTRVLKENKKEEIMIPQGKMCYMKIYTYGKVLPLKVNMETKYGVFETFVSRSREKLNLNECDLYSTHTQFDIDYGPLNDDLQCLFFGINAMEQTKVIILCSFVVKSNIKTGPELPATPQHSRTPKPKSKGVYEFFEKNLEGEKLRLFEDTVYKIQEEKRQKAIIQARGQNFVNGNIDTAKDFPRRKELQVLVANQKWQQSLEQGKESMKKLETQKKKIRIYHSFRTGLNKLETEYEENRKRKRKEKYRFDGSWAVLCALFSMMRGIVEKKRATYALRMMLRIKEMKVMKIQRMVRNFLSRPKSIKIVGDKGTYVESTEIETKIQINLYECLNALVLWTRPSKAQKAEAIVASVMENLIIPLSILEKAKAYTQQVRKIQELWRIKQKIFNTKVQVFGRVWNQFCANLIEEENKNPTKKKKYSSILPKIREYHVLNQGRKYVKYRMNLLLANLEVFNKDKQSAIKNAENTLRIPIATPVSKKGRSYAHDFTAAYASIKTSSETKHTVNKARNANLRPNAESKDEDNFEQKKLIKFIKPTHDELKFILDKIIEEINVEKDS